MIAHFYQNVILKNPKAIFVLLIIAILSFGYYSKNFQLDASSDTLLLENDPDLKYLREVNKKYGNKATIKLPCTEDGLSACQYLTSQHIRVNMTLVFSVNQAILCSIAGATYVSPFVGRLNDNGQDGVQLITDIAKVFCHKNSDTQILAASLRDSKSVADCFAAGTHICTIPAKVFDAMHKHVLTDKGLFQFKQDFDANLGSV